MPASFTAKLQFLNESGNDLLQLVAPGGAVLYSINALGGIIAPPVAITASGAIAPRVADDYVITKAGVAALTLAAPTSGADDGTTITVFSNTAFAHTITATGILNTGSASVNVATFAAFAGASIVLQAYLGKWNVMASTGITFS